MRSLHASASILLSLVLSTGCSVTHYYRGPELESSVGAHRRHGCGFLATVPVDVVLTALAAYDRASENPVLSDGGSAWIGLGTGISAIVGLGAAKTCFRSSSALKADLQAQLDTRVRHAQRANDSILVLRRADSVRVAEEARRVEDERRRADIARAARDAELAEYEIVRAREAAAARAARAERLRRFPPPERALVERGQIRVGMTIAMVREALGPPVQVLEVKTTEGTRERWFYRSRWVDFASGVVTAIVTNR